MNTLKDEDVVINLKLLKRCHFYQMFDPSEKIIFAGWNVHQFFNIVCVGIVQCFIIYGCLGLFFENEDIDIKHDYFIFIFTDINMQSACLKLFVYLYNANKISDLLNVTRLDFFTSEQCVDYKNTLYSYREKFRKFISWYAIFSVLVLMQWLIFPIITNMFTTSGSSNVRLQNIVNINFGVSNQTYNQYFVIFYIIEFIITLYSIYSFLVTDLLFISFYAAIMSQQKVLVLVFKNFGHNDKLQTNCFEEFKSILHDQVQLNVKIKSLFVIVKHFVLFTVACDSTSIVVLTYRFVMVYLKMEPDMVLTLLKLGSTVIFMSIQLYIYCYLFDNMNIQRELINFSLYSCNWTKMDLKFKKLLLLAMRTNDADNLLMKASPKKIINLQIFANIMSTSYNVISVMLKTTNTKNEISG